MPPESLGEMLVIWVDLKSIESWFRPDLIDRCQPILGSKDGEVYGLSSSDICTQTDNRILKDGFRSFPSGHSSCKESNPMTTGQEIG